MNFIELTHEDGHRIILSMDEIAKIAPLGGDERRGCAVTLKRRGAEMKSRHIRVKEGISAFSASLRPIHPRRRAEFRLSWTMPSPEPRQKVDHIPPPATARKNHLHIAHPQFASRGQTLKAANRS